MKYSILIIIIGLFSCKSDSDKMERNIGLSGVVSIDYKNSLAVKDTCIGDSIVTVIIGNTSSVQTQLNPIKLDTVTLLPINKKNKK